MTTTTGRQADSNYYNNNQRPGETKRQVGKALIVLGILISVLMFFAGEPGFGLIGFLINIIGIALYASGNRDQGRDTVIVGGGFVSTG